MLRVSCNKKLKRKGKKMKRKLSICMLALAAVAVTNYVQADAVPILAYKLTSETPKDSWAIGVATPINKQQLSCYNPQSLILDIIPVGGEFKGEIIDTTGKIIQKGTPIVKIEKKRFINDLRIAQETLAAKTAIVKQKKAELERTDKLVGKNAISRQKHEESIAEYKTATADWISAKSQVDQAKLAIEHCEIKAPFNGIVTKHLWSPGATRGDGDEIVEVMNVDYFLVGLENTDSNIGKFLDDSMTYKVFSRHSNECSYAFNPKVEADGKVFLIVENSRVPRVFPVKEQEKLPRIRKIFGLANYAEKLWTPLSSINKDEKGTFIYVCKKHTTNLKDNHEWVLNKVYIEINNNLIFSSVIANFVLITKGPDTLNSTTTMVLCDKNSSFKDGTIVFLQPLALKFGPGEKVLVNVPEVVSAEGCSLIPESSLNLADSCVFKIVDGKAKKVTVEVIRSVGTYYEVKSDELKPGEFIAVPKGKGLEDGSELMNISDWNDYSRSKKQ
jgi:hypothetical protein